jgi:hypothetical protein
MTNAVNSKSLVIIPSVRNPEVIKDYVVNAKSHNFKTESLYFLILTEDFVDKSLYEDQLKFNSVEGKVFNQTDRDKYLESEGLSKFIDLIPRRSHAETSFGLLYMYMHSEFEYGFMIDDDTKPENNFDFFGDHIRNLNFSGEITEVSSDNGWVNVLYQNFDRHKLYPRGFPYSKINSNVGTKKVKVNKGDIWISQGLWTNVPDLDAIRILMDGDLNGQSKTRLSVNDYKENFVVAKDNFLTVCSMNLAFRREVIPFFYQFPMDDNPWKIGRFDDIWSGIVAKKVLDSIGKKIITGFPLCVHNKAPRNTFKDISAEAPGYESNEYFSEMPEIEDGDIFKITNSLAKHLALNGKTDYIRYCGTRLQTWISLIDEYRNRC